MLNQYFWHGEVYKSKQLRQYWVSDVLGETNDTNVSFVSPNTSKPSTVGGRIIQTLADFTPLPPIVQCWPVGEGGWLEWTNQIKPLTTKHLFTETTLKSGVRGWWSAMVV